MKTAIPSNNYHDDKIFSLEKEKLFSNTWQLIGFKRDLENNRDYITENLAGLALVIRNCDGKIKAFHNVCSHRFNKICIHKKGNGFLKCGYHGWAYDDNGVPKGIPERECFENLDVKALTLKEYQVDFCGEFVFVKLKEGGLSLKESMTGLYEIVQEIGNSLGEKVDTNEIEINANWKIVLENTLEGYHVKEIHPESINKLGIVSNNNQLFGANSMVEVTMKTTISSQKKIEKTFQSRPFQIDCYQHFLIFPNITIATAFGTSFSIQQIIPISSEKTRFISHVFATKLDETNLSPFLRKAFNSQAVSFNRQVFEEDAGVCETVHQGMKHTYKEFGPLHKDEERIFAFHQAYLREMQ